MRYPFKYHSSALPLTGNMKNCLKKSWLKTWLESSKRQDVSSLAITWSIELKAIDVQHLINQRISCSAWTRYQMIPLWKEKSWSTLGHIHSKSRNSANFWIFFAKFQADYSEPIWFAQCRDSIANYCKKSFKASKNIIYSKQMWCFITKFAKFTPIYRIIWHRYFHTFSCIFLGWKVKSVNFCFYKVCLDSACRRLWRFHQSLPWPLLHVPVGWDTFPGGRIEQDSELGLIKESKILLWGLGKWARFVVGFKSCVHHGL